jgi:serine protease inhibitor ecotin
MRTIIFAAAIACSTAAFAQTSDTTYAAPAPTVETGATTKIIAVGEHYTVHRVMADGTVMVQTLTGEQAKLAMAGELTPQLASADFGVTQGAGTVTPQ